MFGCFKEVVKHSAFTSFAAATSTLIRSECCQQLRNIKCCEHFMTDGFSYRSNLMGTKFTVYDNGTNPCKNPGALLEENNTRQELAAICYVSG